MERGEGRGIAKNIEGRWECVVEHKRLVPFFCKVNVFLILENLECILKKFFFSFVRNVMNSHR